MQTPCSGNLRKCYSCEQKFAKRYFPSMQFGDQVLLPCFRQCKNQGTADAATLIDTCLKRYSSQTCNTSFKLGLCHLSDLHDCPASGLADLFLCIYIPKSFLSLHCKCFLTSSPVFSLLSNWSKSSWLSPKFDCKLYMVKTKHYPHKNFKNTI